MGQCAGVTASWVGSITTHLLLERLTPLEDARLVYGEWRGTKLGRVDRPPGVNRVEFPAFNGMRVARDLRAATATSRYNLDDGSVAFV